MKITVRVKPNSKQDRVDKTGDNEFVVRVREKALEGRANKAVVDILSDRFNIPKTNIRIIKGLKSRTKIFDIILDRTAFL
jgi:hypothetical protein